MFGLNYDYVAASVERILLSTIIWETRSTIYAINFLISNEVRLIFHGAAWRLDREKEMSGRKSKAKSASWRIPPVTKAQNTR